MHPRPGRLLQPDELVRSLVRNLEAYVPGEQPKIKGLIKLNTNENPYGPSPQVKAIVRRAIDGRLRLYPNPTADGLRTKLAAFHGCGPENIIVGNGSDELLALATRTFVEPLTGLTHYALHNAKGKGLLRRGSKQAASLPAEVSGALSASRYEVQYFQPSYSLYSVLAAAHGAYPRPVSLEKDFSLPGASDQPVPNWDARAALTFVTTPNAPSGRGYSHSALERLCQSHQGVVILDEAYVDFAEGNAMELALRYPHVIVSRTFSKAYSLCFLRVGYFVGHPALITALHKMRDSYNVNGVGQVAAEATLDSLDYYQRNFRRILASRGHLTEELTNLGFEVLPSQTNFLLTRPPEFTAEEWLAKLREQKVLVRWFSAPDVRDYLRITVGTESEVQSLLRVVRRILGQGSARNRTRG